LPPIIEGVPQHPSVTIGWAVAGLETAIVKLSDGPAERRVRAQFHQLLLALERARLPTDHQQPEIRAQISLSEDANARISRQSSGGDSDAIDRLVADG
jgi:hypothetical protein